MRRWDGRQRFLSLWLAKMTEDDYLCYDITSVSSYAKGNEYVKYGYNRYEAIASPERYRRIDDSESLYVVTDLRRWGEDRRRAYLHIYYNARQAAAAVGFCKAAAGRRSGG